MLGYFSYDKFVSVDEKEWNICYTGISGKNHTISFPVTIGGIEWQISSTDSGCIEKEITLSCTSVTARSVDQVHVEIHGYCRVGNAPNYGPGIKYHDKNSYNYFSTPLRHVFKQGNNSVDFKATAESSRDLNASETINILFVVRVLKDRASLPDFKSEVVQIGCLKCSVKLRFADLTFHVNKEMLSAHSKVFDRMFNSESKEANQEEIQLEHEPLDAALFHDFLLVLCVHNVLPNRKNLVGLFKLADYYEADNLREKCERHFRMCREMPIEERFMLALELGNKHLQNSILNSVDLVEAKRIIAVFVEKERAAALLMSTAEPTNKKRRLMNLVV